MGNKKTQEEKVEKKENIFKRIVRYFKNAFKDMKESAKVQHEVDKANFAAAKAEAKANFEENRFTNTYAKAKEQAKESWDNAHLTSSERVEKTREAQQKQITEANERREQANKRYEASKVTKDDSMER